MKPVTFALVLFGPVLFMGNLPDGWGRPVRERPKPATERLEHAFDVTDRFGDRAVFEFHVHQTGVLTVQAVWSGDAPILTLILNGPSREEFARVQGRTPLRLRYQVSPEILRKGTNWKISIINFSRQGSARGTLQIAYPSEKSSPQTRFTGPSPITKPRVPRGSPERIRPVQLPPTLARDAMLDAEKIRDAVKFFPLSQNFTGVDMKNILKMKTLVEIPAGIAERTLDIELTDAAQFFIYDFVPGGPGVIRARLRWQGKTPLRMTLFSPGKEESNPPLQENQAQEVLSVRGTSPLELTFPQTERNFSGKQTWVLVVQRQTPGTPAVAIKPPVSASLDIQYPRTMRIKPGPWLALFLNDLDRHFRGHTVPGLSPALQRAPRMRTILKDMYAQYENLPSNLLNRLHTLPVQNLFGPIARRQQKRMLHDAVNQTMAQIGLEDLKPRQLRSAKKIPIITRTVPTITAIESQRPNLIGIHGMNFAGHGIQRFSLIGIQRTAQQVRPNLVVFSPDVDTPRVEGGVFKIPEKNIVVTPYLVFLVVTRNFPPGKYEIFLANENGVSTDSAKFWLIPADRPKTYQYEVYRVKCNDETNPEKIWFTNVSDEVYAVFSSIVTRIDFSTGTFGLETLVDTEEALTKSPTKGGFDDRETKAVSWFPLGRRPLRLGPHDGVVTTVVLMEDDIGGMPDELEVVIKGITERLTVELVSEGIETALLTAGAAGSMETLGASIAAAVLAYIAAEALEEILNAIFAAMEDDRIGSEILSFTGAELEPGKGKEGTIILGTGGDSGKYTLYYRIRP